MRSPQHPNRSRYRVIDGVPSVELKLRTPRQLFDERDPAPFRDRDLDDDAARYILTSFRDLQHNPRIKLSLYFETLGEFAEKPETISNAIRAFFNFEAEVKRLELKEIFRQGFISLAIGVTLLFIYALVHHWLGDKPKFLFQSMMREGLFLVWWVAMWRPASIFLYEWWPIRKSMDTYRRLAEIEITIREATAEAIRSSEREMLTNSATTSATTPAAGDGKNTPAQKVVGMATSVRS